MLFEGIEGIVAQLDESDPAVKSFALQALNDPEIINYHWAEVADQLPKIEALSEDRNFADAGAASLLASKLFFHLGEFNDALIHALSSGDRFDVSDGTEYTRKMTEQCVDAYKNYQRELRLAGSEGRDPTIPEPVPRLVGIVVQMFEEANQSGSQRNALGLAIDIERTDLIEQCVAQCPPDGRKKLLDHLFGLCMNVIKIKAFRNEVLDLLVTVYNQEEDKNYGTLCQCLYYLGRPNDVSNILCGLVQSNDVQMELTAYQTAFDLAGYQDKKFSAEIVAGLPALPEEDESAKEKDENAMDTDGPAPTSSAISMSPKEIARFKRLNKILTGNILIPLNLKFLFRNNRSDLVILKQIKEAVPERKAELNEAVIWANGIMHCGTTIDQFLRDNLDWMARAQHWSKFTTVASLGMIHARHLEESNTILERYLPGSGGGPYQEGGALYAMGIIHVGDINPESRNYLLGQLNDATNEILQHGACLGIGLSCLGSNDEEVAESVKKILFQDRASPGEAAGIALGMIMAGQGCRDSRWYEDMISYSGETQHEKIIRALAIGIALMNYNCEEEADFVIDEMLANKDESIRYGACYVVGLAYVASGNNNALRRLLHIAVSDVSNDVRRAAVTNVGFVLANMPEQVPQVVQLLATSYNPYVRYGAAAAVAIACAGTGNSHAMRLLIKLTEDTEPFVRQGAFIACGMMLMQQNEKENEKVKEVKELFLKTVKNKHEPTMSKLGAILGTGFIDACGRNATISLMTPSGQKKMAAIVGTCLFWQYWSWYPVIPMASLMFESTMLMGLNANLEMPKMQFKSNVSSDMFAYVQPIKEEAEKKEKKLEKAVLSVTAKQKARQAQKAKAKAEQTGGDVEMKDATAENAATEANGDAKADGDADGDAAMPDATEEKKSEESGDASETVEEKVTEFTFLDNPARVTPNQRKFILCEDERYEPVAKNLYGIVIVRDRKPDEDVELVPDLKPDTGGVHGDEAPVPEPFLYLGD